VTLKIVGESAGAVLAAAAIFSHRLHDDPVEVTAQQADELWRLA